MRRPLLDSLQIWFKRLALFTLVLLLALAAWGVQRRALTAGSVLTALGRLTGLPGLPLWQAAIIAGHRGFDSGAVCDDGLTEAEITGAVARQTESLLHGQGVYVRLLDEYDPVLDGLESDVLLSIHVDSCVPLSGFKVTAPIESAIPAADERLRACVEQRYMAATGLAVEANTITEDMTGYHAFQRVSDSTPGAIIEIGFLGGDRQLLTEGQDRIAQGIAAGVLCFLQEGSGLGGY